MLGEPPHLRTLLMGADHQLEQPNALSGKFVQAGGHHLRRAPYPPPVDHVVADWWPVEALEMVSQFKPCLFRVVADVHERVVGPDERPAGGMLLRSAEIFAAAVAYSRGVACGVIHPSPRRPIRRWDPN